MKYSKRNKKKKKNATKGGCCKHKIMEESIKHIKQNEEIKDLIIINLNNLKLFFYN